MTINSLSGVGSVKGLSAIEKSAQTVKLPQEDSITLSSEAKTMGEVCAISENLQAVPDIRMDRVEAVAQKIKTPDYINQTVLNDVAGKLAKMLGI